ncbi:hypothetical protein [Bacillus sp. FJAT-26390]|uniref:hypothetical protein n=1 Tax=Bacillus sp. FJAT-26390 TaxID=1743142 RepID=UPI000807DBB9|nr:hypothetical protein [Bacillus sp. FJAT-26390]OBZ17096.1 hypothetical protein A7975_04200 [Bacillus sp. FJAT-26390]
MDYINPVEIDLNTLDDEPFQLYYEKHAKKEQFTKQFALLLSKTMERKQLIDSDFPNNWSRRMTTDRAQTLAPHGLRPS